MNKINVLDCTLRDGGYVNSFCFGEFVINDIVDKLSKASIDIIECGFLVSGETDKDKSLFDSVESISPILKNKNPNLMYVAMIQYGAISIDEISKCDGTSIDGIRLTFHEHEIDGAFVLGEQLKNKGYKVFMQPVGTMTYTNDALLKLVERINELTPFAFYMVDTLGTMYKQDLLKMFNLVDGNLHKGIVLGFHSHNNLQMSFSNAQELLQIKTERELIIDASVFGMGRGAGNLNTELITRYINDNISLKYDVVQILEVLDTHIKPLSMHYKWGYDAAYYIAAVSSCHPNYAAFLLNKQTLHVQDIQHILSNLEVTRRALFDKEYISQEYVRFMNRHVDDSESLKELKSLIKGKKVLLIAPGKSIKDMGEEINSLYNKGEYYIISINFIPKDFQINSLFISNIKRFSSVKELSKNYPFTVFATSNITIENDANVYVLDYLSYTNEDACIFDNSGLMCLNALKKIGVKEVYLMGFDGFSTNVNENYYDIKMVTGAENEKLISFNEAMARKIAQLSVQMDIKFLTNSNYKK